MAQDDKLYGLDYWEEVRRQRDELLKHLKVAMREFKNLQYPDQHPVLQEMNAAIRKVEWFRLTRQTSR